jgi:YHS domain-containing protein
MAVDPVCGREVDTAGQNAVAGHTRAGTPEVDPEYGTRRFHNGKWYVFCSLDCRSKFMANPDQYIKEGAAS